MEKAVIAGRVGQDAIIREFGGNQYTSFSVAVDKSYKKSDGTKVEKNNWWSVLLRGTGLQPYIKKGQSITVFGEMNLKSDRDQNSQPIIRYNLNASDVTLGSIPQGSTPTTSPQTENYTHPSTNAPQPVQEVHAEEVADDDLPF